MNLRPPAIAGLLLLCSGIAPLPTTAQSRPDPAPLMAAQREAMATLQAMDGVWRGAAWTLRPSGEKHHIVQTERIGPFLVGWVLVLVGGGLVGVGLVGLFGLGVVWFNPATRAYSMRSHALGQAGDFVFAPTAGGYSWEIPAGPVTIRYTAVIKDGTLHEVGDRIVPGREPQRFFEMTLKRVGDSDWPAAGAIGPK